MKVIAAALLILAACGSTGSSQVKVTNPSPVISVVGSDSTFQCVGSDGAFTNTWTRVVRVVPNDLGCILGDH